LWLEGFPAAVEVAGDEGVDPPVGDAVVAGYLRFGTALDDDRDHDDAVFVHASLV
jgi:hypothetical protein